MAEVFARIEAAVEPGIFIILVVMSPGPGRIESEMRIELPRPRDVAAPDFNAIRRDLSLKLHGPRKAA